MFTFSPAAVFWLLYWRMWYLGSDLGDRYELWIVTFKHAAIIATVGFGVYVLGYILESGALKIAAVLIIIFSAIVFVSFLRGEKEIEDAKEAAREKERREQMKQERRTESILRNLPRLLVPDFLHKRFTAVVSSVPVEDRGSIIETINYHMRSVPDAAIPGSRFTFGEQFADQFPFHMIPDSTRQLLKDASWTVPFPPERTKHTHIVAQSGAGKTQLLQSLILDDIANQRSVVVIDSQRQMIDKLIQVVPPDRLVHVDPRDWPVALPLFNSQGAKAMELYEYIFAALDAELTAKQQTVYRYVTALMFVIPNATIFTMLDVLKPNGLAQYQEYLDQLSPTERDFLESEFTQKQYHETKDQIRRRLYQVLQTKALSDLLSVTETKLSLPDALNSGKVILISTDLDHLGDEGAKLFGRIWIAQLAQAFYARTGNENRVHVYIDEFGDYVEEDSAIIRLFEQSRKYNVGLTVAHQYLGQLTPKMQQAIATNTEIKAAANLSPQDARIMAQQMRTEPYMLEQPTGTFYVSTRQQQYRYPVKFGRLEAKRDTQNANVTAIRADQRSKYRVEPKRPAERKNDPDSGFDVPEFD